MSDNTELPGGGPVPRDPWAPPDSRVDLGKQTGDARPPTVHDQQTVTSMPGVGTGQEPWAGPGTGPIPAPGPSGFGPPQAGVPAPPIAPNGPGQPAGPEGQYGYPAQPAAQYGGYPGYPGYGAQPGWVPAPANGLGIAAMVLGIIGVVAFCMWGLGVLLGLLALIFGIVGHGRAKRGEATNSGMALAGIILGAVSIVFGALFLGFLIWGVSQAEDRDRERNYDSEYGDPYATSLVVDVSR